MRAPIIIGELEFNSKKDALLYFKIILNSYVFKQKLNQKDFVDVCQLIGIHENATDKKSIGIKEIVIEEVRYKTKCFKIVRTDSTTEIFSYTKCINGSFSQMTKFSRTCRDIVCEDLRLVKLQYFKDNSVNGKVKCQETGELCTWEELNVDHRQPNTFSVIIDRFVEVNHLSIDKIEYDEIMDSVYTFKDGTLSEKFKKYHKEKANLRLVKKDKNLRRSHQGRICRQKKDLTIK